MRSKHIRILTEQILEENPNATKEEIQAYIDEWDESEIWQAELKNAS